MCNEKARTQFLPAKGLGIGVETEENGLVDEGVLVLRPGALLGLLTSGADNGLNLIRVNETGDVGVADLGSGETKCIKVQSLSEKIRNNIKTYT